MKFMSNEYQIEIEETLSKVIKIKANSLNEALNIVQEKYSNEEYVLDSNDFLGVEIRPFENEVMKKKEKNIRESR